MVRKESILFILITAIAICTFFPEYSASNQWAKPQEKETITPIKGAVHKKMEVRFGDGDSYWMHQVQGKQNEQPYTFTVPITSTGNVTFRYREYTEANQPYWKIINLKDARDLPLVSGFIEAPDMHMWLGMPTVYTDKGRGTIDEKRELSLPVEVRNTASGFVLQIKLPIRAGHTSEAWALQSREPLVSWGDPILEKVWLALDVTQNAKWLYDGYYYTSPSTYEPYTPSSYWRVPENYVLRSFLYTGGSRAARDMGYVMLKTSLRQQEPGGYWKSLPRSQWLYEDYGIPEGFYDTRFNTGAADLMLRGCMQYQEEAFCESAKKYAVFFQSHAASNHYVIEGVQTGWLVEDYASPIKKEVRTHVSLNHQLAEINYLYSSYLHFGNPTDKDLADLMLRAVVNLGSKWILGNGDLHYAYFPNGTFGRPDYPYLTYNDLVETQRLYHLLYGMEEATIAKLITSKLAWMKHNNVAYVK
ncbi:hypothetical protein [Brevibacillus sp. NRS-1366]|uniref:hypothetical protein n=1 Tax=Brevibacillus sp. NRS-1366 TaxID=3233899 RepID=UPI003D23CC87